MSRSKLDPAASLTDLKAAFRKASLELHPDLNPHPEAATRFRALHETYLLLEAQARLRERPAPPRRQSPATRAAVLLQDLADLKARRPVAFWDTTLDGLPRGVWRASLEQVLTELAAPDAPARPLRTLHAQLDKAELRLKKLR